MLSNWSTIFLSYFDLSAFLCHLVPSAFSVSSKFIEVAPLRDIVNVFIICQYTKKDYRTYPRSIMTKAKGKQRKAKKKEDEVKSSGVDEQEANLLCSLPSGEGIPSTNF